MNSKIKSYLKERYGNYFVSVDKAAVAYEGVLVGNGYRLCEYPYGFFTAKKQGDALIIGSLYTTDEARGNGMAWALFYDIKRLAHACGANVIIGFSEHEGQNRHLGQRAMLGAGFKPLFDTHTATVYMRGTH